MIITHPPKPDLREPALDPRTVDGLLQLSADDDRFVEELFEAYLKTYHACARGMQEALSQGDARALRDRAHILKGASANVGAWRLAEHCSELQRMGDSGQLDGVDRWLVSVQAEFTRVLEEIRELLPGCALELPRS
jgi:HPt (histidine-containing phosphotransfer) domain-containing protein